MHYALNEVCINIYEISNYQPGGNPILPIMRGYALSESCIRRGSTVCVKQLAPEGSQSGPTVLDCNP